MDYDILKSVSQGSDGAQDAENSRIAAIADELRRLCQLHEAQPGTGQAHVTPFEREQRMAEQMAKARGLSVPLHLLASNVLVPISDVSFYNNFVIPGHKVLAKASGIAERQKVYSDCRMKRVFRSSMTRLNHSSSQLLFKGKK